MSVFWASLAPIVYLATSVDTWLVYFPPTQHSLINDLCLLVESKYCHSTHQVNHRNQIINSLTGVTWQLYVHTWWLVVPTPHTLLRHHTPSQVQLVRCLLSVLNALCGCGHVLQQLQSLRPSITTTLGQWVRRMRVIFTLWKCSYFSYQ